jgi:hypothetical protein
VDETQHVAGGAVYLRRTPQRVGVLNPAAVLVRLVDAASLEQPAHVGGRRRLAGERTRGVDAFVERMDGSAQRVERQRDGDVGGARQPLGGIERERRDRGRRLGAVDQREPLLGAEDHRLEPCRPERVAPVQ